MILITLKHLVLFISLSHVTLALDVLIGYRRAHPDEAREINRLGNIFRDNVYDQRANEDQAAQIGNGVYLSMKVNGYDGTAGSWYCYVTADAGRLRQAPKVWIPKSLWDFPEINIAAFITPYMGEGESPDHTLRFSQIKGYFKGTIQMLIPTRMVQDDTLRTKAFCYPNRHDLPVSDPVDYGWRNFRNKQ
ncbi:hypothetical protein LZ31DRAFT_535918 [Colletotrichum somersetense]|nr:hypothetical protein LZ31DRAFT_535918 [Colletotrichum somersetense]